ncbi:MAG: hypothetical protein AAF231_06495 [Pseudomonadota bacterium]
MTTKQDPYRIEFCQFLDELLSGTCSNETWVRNIVTHYHDEVLEAARLKVSRATHKDDISDLDDLSERTVLEINLAKSAILQNEVVL